MNTMTQYLSISLLAVGLCACGGEMPSQPTSTGDEPAFSSEDHANRPITDPGTPDSDPSTVRPPCDAQCVRLCSALRARDCRICCVPVAVVPKSKTMQLQAPHPRFL